MCKGQLMRFRPRPSEQVHDYAAKLKPTCGSRVGSLQHKVHGDETKQRSHKQSRKRTPLRPFPGKAVPYVGERLGRLIVKFLPTALAGEGRALLRELIDKKALGNESRVIEEAMRLLKMAHTPVPVSAANKYQGKKGKRAL
eukprot:1742511-Pleurochrysis_carterae.AAC.2